MKKIVFILLVLFPFVINAECDYTKHEEYVKIASNITYDNSYSKSAGMFIVTLYNVFNGMHVKYNGQVYNPNSESEVVINSIPQGQRVILDIYADDGCDMVRKITIIEPYFNKYYGSKKCVGYENVLTMCSSQFTSSEINDEILNIAIKNHNNTILQETEKEIEQEVGLFTRIKEFMLNWGIKIVLFVVTSGICWAFYTDKFRKIKHGI